MISASTLAPMNISTETRTNTTFASLQKNKLRILCSNWTFSNFIPSLEDYVFAKFSKIKYSLKCGFNTSMQSLIQFMNATKALLAVLFLSLFTALSGASNKNSHIHKRLITVFLLSPWRHHFQSCGPGEEIGCFDTPNFSITC